MEECNMNKREASWLGSKDSLGWEEKLSPDSKWNEGRTDPGGSLKRRQILPHGKSEMTETQETPGKFLGTERRGNVDVFLDRGPGDPRSQRL